MAKPEPGRRRDGRPFPRGRGRARAPRLPEALDLHRYLDFIGPELRTGAMGRLLDDEVQSLDGHWPGWAHEGQLPPPGDWRTWVLMAGRGFGKTLAGANWVWDAVRAGPADLRVALVAGTIDEARLVMVEGRSGLLHLAGDAVDKWSAGRGVLRFATGAEARIFSGAAPEQLRGPEHHIAWCDELAKWARPRDAWDNLQLGLRLGERPRALVTTTPRAGPVLRAIMAEPGCVVTGGRTAANPHLPAAFRETAERLYGGTRLGAQELDGVLLPDSGALWTPELLERCRVGVRTAPFLDFARNERMGGLDRQPPDRDAGSPIPFASSAVEKHGEGERTGGPADMCLDYARNERVGAGPYERVGMGPLRGTAQESVDRPFTRTLIGVDPPAGDGTCGIIVCAIDPDGVGHVLADHSVTARSPEGWARAVADAGAVHGTREVVAERNQGGRMVEAVLRAADADLRVTLVHASDAKTTRADPVALLFEAGGGAAPRPPARAGGGAAGDGRRCIISRTG